MRAVARPALLRHSLLQGVLRQNSLPEHFAPQSGGIAPIRAVWRDNSERGGDLDNLYSSQIARIRQKLSQFRDIRLNPPATIDQVETAERDHNVQFPIAYKRFLLEVSDGGSFGRWPLYPLMSALSMIEGPLSSPFPFTGIPSVDEQTEARLSSENIDYDLDGALTVFYEGCTHSDILVMNGPYVGTVMYDGRGTDQGFIPYTQPLPKPAGPDAKPKRLDYLGWFENKLDKA